MDECGLVHVRASVQQVCGGEGIGPGNAYDIDVAPSCPGSELRAVPRHDHRMVAGVPLSGDEIEYVSADTAQPLGGFARDDVDQSESRGAWVWYRPGAVHGRHRGREPTSAPTLS